MSDPITLNRIIDKVLNTDLTLLFYVVPFLVLILFIIRCWDYYVEKFLEEKGVTRDRRNSIEIIFWCLFFFLSYFLFKLYFN